MTAINDERTEPHEITTPADIPAGQMWVESVPGVMALLTGVQSFCVRHDGTAELEYTDGSQERAHNALPILETIPQLCGIIDAVQCRRPETVCTPAKAM